MSINIFEAFEGLTSLTERAIGYYRGFYAQVDDEGVRRFLSACIDSKEAEFNELKGMLDDMRIAHAFREMIGAEIDADDYRFQPSQAEPATTVERLQFVFELEKLFARIYTDLTNSAEGELRQDLSHFRDRATRQSRLAENLQDLQLLRG